MDAHDIIWNSVKEMVFCSRDEYIESIKDWTLHEILRNGELAGVVMIKGNEIHCAVNDTFRGRWGFKDSISLLRPGMVTQTNKRNLTARRFLERLGFRFKYEDEYDAHYEYAADAEGATGIALYRLHRK
jgi:hypothetical protein